MVAASAEPRAVIERVLVGHELSCADTLPRAQRFLREDTFDLIICTIVFDESKLFDLLRFAKSQPEWQQIPFLGARVRSHILQSRRSLEAAAVACQELGAAAFLNIADYKVEPERELRDAIEKFIGARY